MKIMALSSLIHLQGPQLLLHFPDLLFEGFDAGRFFRTADFAELLLKFPEFLGELRAQYRFLDGGGSSLADGKMGQMGKACAWRLEPRAWGRGRGRAHLAP